MLSKRALLIGTLAGLLLGASPLEASTTQRTVAVGLFHACAVTSSGRLKCWGSNDFGQLGDGSTTSSALPVDVVGLDRAVVAVSASYYHTCAIVTGGGLLCWGRNVEGQLGDGTGVSRLRPTPVVGLSSGVKTVAAGYRHTCALSQQGTAMCWGANESAQLGDGTFVNSLQPVTVAGLPSGLADIEAAERNNCVLTAEGTVACWGFDGQDYDDCWEEGWYCTYISCGPWTFCRPRDRFRPTPSLDTLLDRGIACIDMPASGAGGIFKRLCGLTPAGDIRCSDTYLWRTAPVDGLPGGTAAISVGGWHTCIADRAGEVSCLGYNIHGELGPRAEIGNQFATPAPVSGLPKGVVEIATGSRSTCVRTDAGDVWCWGDNSNGQLGDGTRVSTVGKVVKVAGVSASSPNYTALWWKPDESGWGINFNHQGDIVYGTLFTYDTSGAPMWLVMSSGDLVSGTTYSGPLYRTTGPPFNADPFTPVGPGNLSQVGTMTVTFSAAGTAMLGYTVNGIALSKSIQKQVYGRRAANCVPTTAARASLSNYQDLWYQPAEAGWGINVVHQEDTLYATLFTYGASGKGLWLVMSAGRKQPDGSFLGDLYETRGPAFNASPFTPIGAGDISTVGTMRFRFSDGNNGTLTYTYKGATVTKQITRQVFSSPVPACS